MTIGESVTSNPTPRYRYGEKRTWEIVLDAVRALGRPATAVEIGDLIAKQIPNFALSNLAPDLSVLSVNCYSRGNHGVNRKPRRTDSGNTYDRLARIGKGRGVRFVEYDPNVHGVWDLADAGEKVLRPRYVCSADSIALETIEAEAATHGMFDPDVDARRRILTTIVQRDGQSQFRDELLNAYSGACAVTGCTLKSLLEAAHIMPYRGDHTNSVENGLLLRADVHKLFDLHMFRIDPQARTLHLCDELKASEYRNLEGIQLREPREPRMRPSKEVLEDHEQYCTWGFVE